MCWSNEELREVPESKAVVVSWKQRLSLVELAYGLYESELVGPKDVSVSSKAGQLLGSPIGAKLSEPDGMPPTCEYKL